MAVNIESDALRPAETREEPVHFAAWGNAVNGIEARCRWTVDVKIIVEAERQMVGRDTRLECRKYEDFFFGIDLEDASATVADVEVAIAIERNAGGNTHPFRIQLRASGLVHSIHIAFIPARDEQFARQAEREPGGVHDVCDKRRHCA